MKSLGLSDVVRRRFWPVLAVMLAVLAMATPAWASEGATSGGGGAMYVVFWVLALAGSIAALVFARKFFLTMIEADEGTDEMKEIAGHVRDGAYAYLRQQYKVVAMFFVVIVILLAFMAFGLKVQSNWVPFAFLTGGFFSGLAGFHWHAHGHPGEQTERRQAAETRLTRACRSPSVPERSWG